MKSLWPALLVMTALGAEVASAEPRLLPVKVGELAEAMNPVARKNNLSLRAVKLSCSPIEGRCQYRVADFSATASGKSPTDLAKSIDFIGGGALRNRNVSTLLHLLIGTLTPTADTLERTAAVRVLLSGDKANLVELSGTKYSLVDVPNLGGVLISAYPAE
jgi:hypothetical protein